MFRPSLLLLSALGMMFLGSPAIATSFTPVSPIPPKTTGDAGSRGLHHGRWIAPLPVLPSASRS